jgi:hypothetical protein
MSNIETIWQSLLTAVAEMREAQREYDRAPKHLRPEAIGKRLKHERIVDQMIADVTREQNT